jgi:hypothetical protein
MVSEQQTPAGRKIVSALRRLIEDVEDGGGEPLKIVSVCVVCEGGAKPGPCPNCHGRPRRVERRPLS